MKNNKTDDLNQNRNKLALILIAIGLIAGGIVGITRIPPSGIVDGWTSDPYPDIRVAITDQNDDGIEDLFYWYNPIDYDTCQTCGDPDESDLTSYVEIVSGKDGSLIASQRYTGLNPWYIIPIDKWNGVVTKNNDFVFLGYFLENSSNEAREKKTKQFDLSKTSLVRIDLDTLKLEQEHNIFDMDWESNEPIENISRYYNEVSTSIQGALDTYTPSIRYLRNCSIATPGSVYDNDVIVFANSFQFTNSTDGFYNNITYSFINPNTLQTITTITWARELNIAQNSTTIVHNTGWCEGPEYAYQENWNMPYFWVVSYLETGSPNIKNLSISVAPISELNNVSTSINWMVNNLTFSRTNDNTGTPDPFKVVLSLNSTSDPVSLAILHTYSQSFGGCLSASDKAANEALLQEIFGEESNYMDHSTFFGSHDDAVHRVSDGRLNVYNIQGAPINTFTYESFIDDEYGGGPNHINTIINEETTGLGVINDIIPIKIDAAPGLTNSSIALICTKGTNYVEPVNHFFYPVMHYEIFTLNKSCIGIIPGQLHNGTSFTGIGGNMFTFLPDFYQYTVDVRFDVDGDDITDIPIPGLNVFTGIDDILSEVENRPANGPFAIFTQNEVIQELYWSLPWYQSVRFVSDLNEDDIPDALIDTRAVAFISITEVVQLSFFELLMSDPLSRILFFLGIGCLVGGIVLLGFVLVKLKKSRISFKTIHKKRQVLMLLITALSVLGLFASLITILSPDTGTGTQIGLTPTQNSLNQLYGTSNIALFIFFMMIPLTAGIYLLLSPITSDGIVALNQIRFAKRAGLEAAIKKEEIKDVEKIAKTNYQILFIPPFGRKERGSVVIGRLLGVIALGLAIGLNVHDLWFTYSGATLPTSIDSLTDPNFGIYMSGLFTFLIVPGILAIPIFFWLLPTSWLLDDAGVVFYAKRLNSRRPEDVERVGGWFSNYLKGFLGISALVSYARFIIESPILASEGIVGTPDVTAVFFFTFGFPIISGFAIGCVALVMHEFTLPRNAQYLYKRLSDRKVAFHKSEIQIVKGEELTSEDVVKGFLQKPVKLKKGNKVKREKKPKKSKKEKRDESLEPSESPEPPKPPESPEPPKPPESPGPPGPSWTS
jgi:hypothetical protein